MSNHPPEMEGDLHFTSMQGLILHHRAEFVAINDHAAFVAIIADLAGHHLHRHADAHRLGAEIGQLGCHNRAFIQFDHRNGIRSLFFKASSRIGNESIGINLALTAKSEWGLGFAAAFRADIAGWEVLGITVRADFTLQ